MKAVFDNFAITNPQGSTWITNKIGHVFITREEMEANDVFDYKTGNITLYQAI